jgi:Fe2+ transport system protein FeoA
MILNSSGTSLSLKEIMALTSPVLTRHAPRRAVEPPALLSLSAAPVGAVARVVRVAADPQDAARLMAMGLCVGRRVQLVKTGDPLIVNVVGARVGLSARLAAGVLVQPLGDASNHLSPVAAEAQKLTGS